MICLLYDEVLCLATTGKIDPVYTVLASIHLGGTKIEEIDNGRGKHQSIYFHFSNILALTPSGLQCHTAPFSWKLSFERDCQLYEIMMTACTPKEETEWRNRLVPPTKGVDDWGESSAFTSLELDIKSLGNVFGKPGMSLHGSNNVVAVLTALIRDRSKTAIYSPCNNRRLQDATVPGGPKEHKCLQRRGRNFNFRPGYQSVPISSHDKQPIASPHTISRRPGAAGRAYV